LTSGWKTHPARVENFQGCAFVTCVGGKTPLRCALSSPCHPKQSKHRAGSAMGRPNCPWNSLRLPGAFSFHSKGNRRGSSPQPQRPKTAGLAFTVAFKLSSNTARRNCSREETGQGILGRRDVPSEGKRAHPDMVSASRTGQAPTQLAHKPGIDSGQARENAPTPTFHEVPGCCRQGARGNEKIVDDRIVCNIAMRMLAATEAGKGLN